MAKPYVIGIAGGSASGKSTLSARLINDLADLRVQIIALDNYFKPREERPYVKAPIADAHYIDDNHPETLHLAKAGQDLTTAIAAEEADVIIIEGVFALWYEPIWSQMDLKLFIDCQADERIVRRLRRNMAHGLNFDDIANVYLDMVRYRHDEYVAPTKWKADLILNGAHLSDIAVGVIVQTVKKNRA